MPNPRPQTPAATVGIIALVALTACQSEDVNAQGGGAGQAPTPESTATVTEAPEPQDPETEEPDSEETEGTEGPPAEPEEDLPPGGSERLEEITTGGEKIETHFSVDGQEVGVAGLAPEDAPIEVRSAPTREAEVVAELGPIDAVLLAGREWHHPALEQEGIWTEIQLADGYGWVEENLYYFGANDDVTEDFIDEVPPTEQEHLIAESVAERAADSDENLSDGEPSGTDWVMISSPDEFNEEFYRADVTGMPDDSIAGERLFVYVQEAADGYELAQVERTLICRRGVSDQGLCI